MATSGTLNAQWSSKYPEALWQFTWTSEVTGPGTTKVSWNLRTVGRYSSPKWLETRCRLTVNGTVYNDWYRNLSEGENSFNDMQRLSGNFTVNHDANGAASFSVTMYGFTYEYATYKTTSQTFSLNTNFPYSRCGAPTSVTISPAIQAPGQNITISWSGASNGTANKIDKYRVWYKIGAGNWVETSEVNVTNGTTSGSKAVTLPSNAARGQNIQACVRAIGVVSGYESSDAYSVTTASKVNTKPNAPTISISIPSNGLGTNNTKVPCGGRRTLTATAGSSNDTGQSPSVYYQLGNNDLVKYTSALTVTSSGTYSFYTWDGLEWSSATSTTFTVNTSSPSISNCTVSGAALASVNKNGTADYIVSPTCKITKASNGQSSGNTYTYTLYSCNASGGSRVSLKTFSSTSTSLSIEDVREHNAPSYSAGYYYRFGVTRNDGIETSGEVFSGVYQITKIPGWKLYNDKTGTRTTDGFFSNKVCPAFDHDAGYNQIELKAVKSSKTQYQKTSANLTSSSTNGLRSDFDVTSLSRGSTYAFSARPKSAKFTPASFASAISSFRVYLPSLGTLSSSGRINPFTTTDYTLSFLNFFDTASPTASNYNQYGLTSSSSLTLAAKYGSTSKRATFQLGTSLDTQSTAKLELTNNPSIRDIFHELGVNINSTSATNVTITLSITNLYGDTVSVSGTQALLYVDSSTKPKVDVFDYSLTYGGEAVTYITEGCQPTISNLKVKNAYHAIEKVQVRIHKGSSVDTIYDKTVTPTIAGGVLSLDSTKLSTISEITCEDYNNTKISVRLKNTANIWSDWKTEDTGKTTLQFTSGAGRITEASWIEKDGKQDLTVTFQVTKFGYNESRDCFKFTSRLYRDKTAVDVSGKGEYFHDDKINPESSKSININVSQDGNHNWSSATYANLSVKVTARIYPNSKSFTKVWTTAKFIVYKASPTLSYRKNQLGINYSFPNLSSNSEMTETQKDSINKSFLTINATENNSFFVINSADHWLRINAKTGAALGLRIYSYEMGEYEAKDTEKQINRIVIKDGVLFSEKVVQDSEKTTPSYSAVGSLKLRGDQMEDGHLANCSIPSGTQFKNRGTFYNGHKTDGVIYQGAIDNTYGTISKGTISSAAISGGTISGTAISGGSISSTTVSGATISGGSISGVTSFVNCVIDCGAIT